MAKASKAFIRAKWSRMRGPIEVVIIAYYRIFVKGKGGSIAAKLRLVLAASRVFGGSPSRHAAPP